MKKLIPLLAITLLLAATACSTTQDIPEPSWLPKVGERVATNFDATKPDGVGQARIVTITKVSKSQGRYLVHAKEFPQGIGLEWVTAW